MTLTHVRSIALALGFGLASTGANALLFNFSGSDGGGTGSATMDVSVAGNTLTAALNNTSPTTLDDNTGVNTPGITGFGFDLSEPTPTLLSWSLTAFDSGGILTTIGSSGGTGTWIIDGTIGGLSLDILACDDDPNCDAIQGALYNPAATEGFGALPHWFTEAVLTLNFDDTPALDAFLGNENCNQPDPCSPFVRMQNVGEDGAGSLRLPGNPDNGGGGEGDPLPEPGTLLLLGIGLLGLWRLRRA